jgi:hypothetical protein
LLVPELLRQSAQRIGVPIKTVHPGALFNQLARDGVTNAAGSAGDDRAATLEGLIGPIQGYGVGVSDHCQK